MTNIGAYQASIDIGAYQSGSASEVTTVDLDSIKIVFLCNYRLTTIGGTGSSLVLNDIQVLTDTDVNEVSNTGGSVSSSTVSGTDPISVTIDGNSSTECILDANPSDCFAGEVYWQFDFSSQVSIESVSIRGLTGLALTSNFLNPQYFEIYTKQTSDPYWTLRSQHYSSAWGSAEAPREFSVLGDTNFSAFKFFFKEIQGGTGGVSIGEVDLIDDSVDQEIGITSYDPSSIEPNANDSDLDTYWQSNGSFSLLDSGWIESPVTHNWIACITDNADITDFSFSASSVSGKLGNAPTRWIVYKLIDHVWVPIGEQETTSDWTTSEERSFSLPDTVISPEMSPIDGYLAHYGLITISCETSGATIYYTTDGTIPTTSSLVYSSPIDVSSLSVSEINIKAFAIKSGLDDSMVTSLNFIYLYLSLSGRLPEFSISAEFNEERIHMEGTIPEFVLATDFDERIKVDTKIPNFVLTTGFGFQAGSLYTPEFALESSISRNNTARLSGILPQFVLTTVFASRTDSLKIPNLKLSSFVSRKETASMYGRIPIPVLEAAVENTKSITIDGKLPDFRLQATIEAEHMLSASGIVPTPILQSVCDLVVTCGMSAGLIPIPVLVAQVDSLYISFSGIIPPIIMAPMATGDITGSGSYMSEHSRFDGTLLRFERWPS